MRENFELINHGQTTPGRLHSLLRLVKRLGKAERQQLLDYLQPPQLVENQEAAILVYNDALHLGLLQPVEGQRDRVTLAPAITDEDLESVDTFRAIMQQRLLGVTEPQQDNYLLNLYAAWYAVQDEWVLQTSRKDDLAIKFNQEIFPRDESESLAGGRAFNTTKLNAWLTWATFLGWGIAYNKRLLPAAQERLTPVLKTIAGRKMTMGEFMGAVAQRCPELDGGELFHYCRQASRPAEGRTQQLSLMLSTALRQFHRQGNLILEHRADATDRWYLYPATGQLLREVNAVEVRG